MSTTCRHRLLRCEKLENAVFRCVDRPNVTTQPIQSVSKISVGLTKDPPLLAGSLGDFRLVGLNVFDNMLVDLRESLTHFFSI